MSKPFYAVIIPLGEGQGPVDPGYGRPGGGGGGPHPDQGLPGGQGGHPSQPIYHPGHPDHGLPPFPDQGLPGGSGGRPDQGLPPHPDNALPPGGQDIPDNELPMPEVPQEYEDNLVIAVKKPHETEWTVRSYEDVEISNPQPTPQQHRRR